MHATNITNKPKRHDQIYDANRNHVVPYYYSETLSPNTYGLSNQQMRNRHTLSSYEDRQLYYHGARLSPRLQSRLNSPISPELAQVYAKNNVYPLQTFRPYSVLETSSKSPVLSHQRPSSVVPMSEQFRPASAFFQNELEKSNEIPEWKQRLQKEMPKPIFKGSDKPFRQICRIPNCKCNDKPIVDPGRFSQVRTLPSAAERSLNKIRNLSLPTLKLDEIDNDDKTEAERDTPALSKPISEQHLGYV